MKREGRGMEERDGGEGSRGKESGREVRDEERGWKERNKGMKMREPGQKTGEREDGREVQTHHVHQKSLEVLCRL